MNRLEIGQIIKAAGATIIPIEQISIARETGPNRVWWQGSKRVYAIVIMSSDRTYAMDTHAHEISVEHLIDAVPLLEDILRSL